MDDEKPKGGMDMILMVVILLVFLYLAPIGLLYVEDIIFESSHIRDAMLKIASIGFWETLYAPIIFILRAVGIEP